jgi:hypothetical protein
MSTTIHSFEKLPTAIPCALANEQHRAATTVGHILHTDGRTKAKKKKFFFCDPSISS